MDAFRARAASSGPKPVGEIVAHLAAGGPTLVALSGGVDSAVVAHLARRALGDRALAATLVGPATSAHEAERAREVARALGLEHAVLDVDPLQLPEYRANPVNRCYFCRSVETARLRAFGDPRGIRRYVDGVHADDLGDERPGIRAMDEAGFEHPLLWAGWGKEDVRGYARANALPNAEAPSDACLASRVAHGERISAELLGRIEAAEAAVRAMGFRRVRVRARGGAARVEVGGDETPRLLDPTTAGRVRAAVAGLGFADVSLDPDGYRPRAGA